MWLAIGMAAMNLMGSAQQAAALRQQENDAIEQQRKQHIEMVREMHYRNADSALRARGLWDVTQDQLTKMDLDSIRNRGVLTAAIGESGMTGNSMKRMKRVLAAEESHNVAAVQENYQRDYAAIFADVIGNTESTRAQIAGAGKIRRTSTSSLILGAAGSALGAYTGNGGSLSALTGLFGGGVGDVGAVSSRAQGR